MACDHRGSVGRAAGGVRLVGASWEAASLHGGRITPEVADYAYAEGNVGSANAWIALASFAICSGWVILSTRVLERWMGWWIIVAGVGLAVAGQDVDDGPVGLR